MRRPDRSVPGIWILRRRKPAADPYGPASGRGAPSTPPSSEAERSGHETRDMSARAMSWLTVALAVSVVSAIGAVVGLMFLFQGFVVSGRPALTERQQALIVPPAPHLQVQPHADLRELRTREEDLLDRYAWLGADHSRARIPIDRAMTLAVGRSLDAGP